jgi:hypothetical protein
LAEKSSDSGLEKRLRPQGSVTLTTWHPIPAKVVTSFVDRRRSLGRYSSLADSGHGVLVYHQAHLSISRTGFVALSSIHGFEHFLEGTAISIVSSVQ